MNPDWDGAGSVADRSTIAPAGIRSAKEQSGLAVMIDAHGGTLGAATPQLVAKCVIVDNFKYRRLQALSVP